MATRRLFSKQVIYSEKFSDLPSDALKLYVYLMLEADDDGFVGHVRTVINMAGLDRNILEMLKSRGLIYEFKSGVCVIVHWLKQNKTQRNGYTPTEYIAERSQLYLDEDVYYLH